jgi:hypothetical protein
MKHSLHTNQPLDGCPTKAADYTVIDPLIYLFRGTTELHVFVGVGGVIVFPEPHDPKSGL